MQHVYSNASLRFTIRYELTAERAHQACLDLWEYRMAQWNKTYPEWGHAKPLWLLGLAAIQVVIAMGALVWMNETLDTTDWVLLGAGGIVLLLILFKASFYVLPFLARWLMGRQSRRLLRELGHHQIEWKLFDDRLETSSAATQRSIPWSRLKSCSQSGQSFVLKMDDGLELLMPTSELSPDAASFLESRLSSSESNETQAVV